MSTNSLNRVFISHSLAALILALAFFAPESSAAESDLWTTHTGSGPTAVGAPITITVGYGNNGPDTAVSAYINSYFVAPMGLDVFIDDFVNGDGAMYNAIQASATGTDTLGNVPTLFWDDFYCENLLFQVSGDENGNPAGGLTPGASGTFTYETTIPMEAPNTGTIQVIEPASIAKAWTLTNPATFATLEAGNLGAYSMTSCDNTVPEVCENMIDTCWGARISQLDEPIEAEFELVNDGTADPTFGCEALIDFTPGNIAVLNRGGCEFGVKGFNAEQAGASAVFMVNGTRGCQDATFNDVCVINMGPGALGALVTIPMSMVSFGDGEPVIAALTGSETVLGAFGGASTFAANGYVFLLDSADTDPFPDNDYSQSVQSIYGVGCSYALDSEHHAFGAPGGVGQVTVTTAPECFSQASTVAPWLSLIPPSANTGSVTLNYQASANTGAGRAAAIKIANQIHIVTQDPGNGCTYAINPTQMSFPGSGGDSFVTLVTQTGCEWAVSPTWPWMRLTSPSTGVGDAVITYSVLPNYDDPRTGAVLVADRILSISQDGHPLFQDGFETGDTSRWDTTSP